MIPIPEWATPRECLPIQFVLAAEAVTANRPRTVISHILDHGYITTAEFKELYGYDHPPRAARDVRDAGIPLETKILEVGGKRLAHYYFGDPKLPQF
jgi:hypothetical protein